jgi:hypothetical protein
MDPSNEKNDDTDHVEKGDAPVPNVLPDPEKERRLVRKLDRTILPWIMLLYLVSYMDRYVRVIKRKGFTRDSGETGSMAFSIYQEN